MFTMVLVEGERKVRKAEGVKLVSPLLSARGYLLLTDRRLLFNGESTWGALAYEASLDNIIGCDVKKPSFWSRGKGELSVTLQEISSRADVRDSEKLCRTAGFKEEYQDMFLGRREEVAKIWEAEGEIRGSVDDIPAYEMIDGVDEIFGDTLRRAVLCELAKRGISEFSPAVQPPVTRLVFVFEGVEQPEAFRSDVMERTEK